MKPKASCLGCRGIFGINGRSLAYHSVNGARCVATVKPVVTRTWTQNVAAKLRKGRGARLHQSGWKTNQIALSGVKFFGWESRSK